MEASGERQFAATPLGYPARLLGPDETYDSVTEKIGGITLEHRRSIAWWAAFLPSSGQAPQATGDGPAIA